MRAFKLNDLDHVPPTAFDHLYKWYLAAFVNSYVIVLKCNYAGPYFSRAIGLHGRCDFAWV